MATCSDDGTLRLWTVASREQALQFQVLDQVSALSVDTVKITSNIQSNAFISFYVVILSLYSPCVFVRLSY